MILKNTFGLTAVMSGHKFKNMMLNTFSGSSLNRKKIKKKVLPNEVDYTSIEPKNEKDRNKKDRSMSARTKSKIGKKIIALSQLYERLSFLTLTFVNEVRDEEAILILRKFLDNMKKQDTDFQYLWVAERQIKNTVFIDNIHFHLITNKFWNIKKQFAYWLELQRKSGIVPRNENYKASSGFDVKSIESKNIKSISYYLTKYVTKNKSTFKCQVWNCSKKISALFTHFYTDYSFLENINKIKDIRVEQTSLEYCSLHTFPLDENTMPFYDRLKSKNRQMWRSIKK